MEAPSQLKPVLWGVVGGAVALATIGFTWGGWVTGSKADLLARQQVQAALVEVLTPICVDKFRGAADAQARLVELKKTARRGIVSGSPKTTIGQTSVRTQTA